MPMAVNWWPVLLAMVTSPSEITSETKEAEATVKGVLPLIVPEVAVIVTPPKARAVAWPPATIEATVLSDELQVAVPVRSSVEPSVKVPVAVNCVRVPSGIVEFAGVTATEDRTGAVTSSVAVPVTPFCEAVMVEEPCA